MAKRIFFVTSGRLAVYEWEAGRLIDPLAFLADEEGISQFSRYLDRTPSEPVHVLVDLVEEEFREETMPHVMGTDRRALVRTKLGRLFRDSTYCAAIIQGRESEGRRDDRVLFSGLIRPDLLAPWIGEITRHRIPLVGVFSLPLLSQAVLKYLPSQAERALVVSLHSAGGLRQTFFHGKELKLSRLAVMPSVEPHGYASYVLGEVEKIRRYLNSLRMLAQDSPLDVFVLGDKKLIKEVERQSPDSITTRHHVVELGDVAREAGIKGRYASPFADRLFAHLLAKRAPATQYASPSQTRYHTMHQSRRWLKVASVVLLAGGVMWGGVKFVEGIEASREADSVQRQATFYEERYQIAREGLPPAPAESEDLKKAVETASVLAEFKTSPVQMMVTLSQGLNAFPDLQVDGLAWRSSADPNALVVGQSRRGSAIASLLGRAEEREEGADRTYQLARVRGHIEPFSGNYREALDMISDFATTLRSLPRVHDVQVLARPLDLGSTQRLQGDASTAADSGEAPFELRVVIEDHALEAG